MTTFFPVYSKSVNQNYVSDSSQQLNINRCSITADKRPRTLITPHPTTTNNLISYIHTTIIRSLTHGNGLDFFKCILPKFTIAGTLGLTVCKIGFTFKNTMLILFSTSPK